MIKSVDSGEGSTNAGFILPDMWHWNRVGKVARYSVTGVIIGPPVVAAAAAVTVVAVITVVPAVIYRKVSESVFQPTSAV